MDTRALLKNDLTPSSSSSTNVSSSNVTPLDNDHNDNDFITLVNEIPVFWEFLTTSEHFRVSSISRSVRRAAFSKFNLWRLKHQREFWTTARQFYLGIDGPIEFDEETYGLESKEHWDIFTRDNILRTRHATPVSIDAYQRMHGPTSFTYEEKVFIFDTVEECNAKADSLSSDLVKNKNFLEFCQYKEAYFKTSLPCWTWALGENLTSLSNIPAHTSKIGGKLQFIRTTLRINKVVKGHFYFRLICLQSLFGFERC